MQQIIVIISLSEVKKKRITIGLAEPGIMVMLDEGNNSVKQHMV